MISISQTVQYINNVACVITTYYGLSTDSKPTKGVGNGSAFIEMDTSKVYFYDAAGESWKEWGADASSVQSASPASLNLSPLNRPGLTPQVIEPSVVEDIEPSVSEPEEEEQEEEEQEDTSDEG